MVRIVAIGGGEIRDKDTLSIDQEILSFSGKKHPKLLFLPTASADSEGYFCGIKNYFEGLGCTVDVLYLIKNPPSKKDIEIKILSADIIYVGGGNTLNMMTIWRRLWVDIILQRALKKDIVLCGLSAGSICWFTCGNSDSRKFTSNSSQLIKVTGLDFVHALHCPHYDVEAFRQEDLKRMMRKSPLVAIALENCCAIEIQDATFRIISSKKWAKAYKIYWKKGEYYKEAIPQQEVFSPIKPLLSK